MKEETPTITHTQARAGQAPRGAVGSVFAAAAAAKKTRNAPHGPRTFDFKAVAIEANVPLPPKIGGKGGISQYAVLAARMKPGSVAWLDEKRAYGLKVWLRKNGAKAEVRKMPDGRYGCWLTELAAKPPTSGGVKGKRGA